MKAGLTPQSLKHASAQRPFACARINKPDVHVWPVIQRTEVLFFQLVVGGRVWCHGAPVLNRHLQRVRNHLHLVDGDWSFAVVVDIHNPATRSRIGRSRRFHSTVAETRRACRSSSGSKGISNLFRSAETSSIHRSLRISKACSFVIGRKASGRSLAFGTRFRFNKMGTIRILPSKPASNSIRT